jgi:uncharacterized protein (DUF1015 family)
MKLFVAYGKLYLDGDLYCLVDARHIPNDTYRVDISHSDNTTLSETLSIRTMK